MRLIKPNFWNKRNIISFLLYPLTIITHSINLFKIIFPKKNFVIKTICVGNIYIGGTGKTSLAIAINKILSTKFKTVFIKKNYKNQQDEINLLKKNGTVITTKNRKNSLTKAEKNKFEVAILDDGLQQKNINFDLKIVCFNSYDGLGNGLVLPAGPLRENISQLKKYDIALLNGENRNYKLKSKLKSINKKLEIFEGKYVATNLNEFDRNKKYLMFCGIGNPHEFEKTLIKYKFIIKNKKIYPDHYKISLNEIRKLKTIAKKQRLNLITTEKDFLRIKKQERKNIKFLKVDLKINNIKKLKYNLITKL